MSLSDPKPRMAEVAIPHTAVVGCPLKGFDLVRVTSCTKCPKFGGMEDRFPGAPVPFAKRFTVQCFGAPVTRPVQTIAE